MSSPESSPAWSCSQSLPCLTSLAVARRVTSSNLTTPPLLMSSLCGCSPAEHFYRRGAEPQRSKFAATSAVKEQHSIGEDVIPSAARDLGIHLPTPGPIREAGLLVPRRVRPNSRRKGCESLCLRGSVVKTSIDSTALPQETNFSA